MDTNIVVSGLRSPSGAAAALLDRALSRAFTLLLSVALALEYEAAANDTEQRLTSDLSEEDVATILASLCAVAEPVYCWFLWRPQLSDPADEMVLETAINGGADGLVSFNRRHFERAAAQFGIPVLSPQQALRRISA
ncbi:MAG: PIN domain-containing protein [Spirochaetaceae bacterium]|nr:PIN domain-containing protein [Spirochaetaceae bacterium]